MGFLLLKPEKLRSLSKIRKKKSSAEHILRDRSILLFLVRWYSHWAPAWFQWQGVLNCFLCALRCAAYQRYNKASEIHAVFGRRSSAELYSVQMTEFFENGQEARTVLLISFDKVRFLLQIRLKSFSISLLNGRVMKSVIKLALVRSWCMGLTVSPTLESTVYKARSLSY